MDSSSILILIVLAVLLTIIIWNNKAEYYIKNMEQNYVSTNPSRNYELESDFNQATPHHHKFKFKLHPN